MGVPHGTGETSAESDELQARNSAFSLLSFTCVLSCFTCACLTRDHLIFVCVLSCFTCAFLIVHLLLLQPICIHHAATAIHCRFLQCLDLSQVAPSSPEPAEHFLPQVSLLRSLKRLEYIHRGRFTDVDACERPDHSPALRYHH